MYVCNVGAAAALAERLGTTSLAAGALTPTPVWVVTRVAGPSLAAVIGSLYTFRAGACVSKLCGVPSMPSKCKCAGNPVTPVRECSGTGNAFAPTLCGNKGDAALAAPLVITRAGSSCR